MICLAPREYSLQCRVEKLRFWSGFGQLVLPEPRSAAYAKEIGGEIEFRELEVVEVLVLIIRVSVAHASDSFCVDWVAGKLNFPW